MSASCSIVPQIRNKQGQIVDSKLFKDVLALVNGDREKAKDLYLQTRTPSFYAWFGNWAVQKDKENGTLVPKEVFNYLDQAQDRVDALNKKYGQDIARVNQSSASGRLEFQVLVSFPTDVSKVVDRNGEPILMYHGSPNQFDEFRIDENSTAGGLWFSMLRSRAEVESTNNVYPVFLNIKDPRYKDGSGAALTNSPSKFLTKEDGTKYDGAIFEPTAPKDLTDLNSERVTMKLNQVVVFDSNQVKSVFNQGQYSTSDNNIYHQIQSPNAERDKKLDARVEAFLKKNGVSVEILKKLVDKDGNKIDSNAVADILYRTVKVVQGQARIDTLPEEAGHFLLEMLGEEHPLFQSMYKEIEKYDIYKEVVKEYSALYKGNEKDLRKEAIAKLISQMIVEQFQEQDRIDRANRWWNKVIKFIKTKILGMSMYELESLAVDGNPFSDAAQKIMNGEYLGTWNMSEDARDEYYQLKKPDEIEDSILNRWKIFLKPGAERYTVIKNGVEHDVKKRVSDRVKEYFAKMNFKQRTELEKSLDEIKAKYGTKGHADIANIIERAVAKRDGVMIPAKVVSTNDSMYSTLESHFTKFVQAFPKSTKLLVEKVIYDERTDEAGTIDLLAIHADGMVDIFDWKFIDFGTKKNKEIPFWKVQALNIQLPRYKEILMREYGIKSFGKVRIVPISAKYNGSKLESIEIGSNDVKAIAESREYLLPMPAFEEMTGDENLDRLLQSLIQEKLKIEGTKPGSTLTPEQRIAFIERRNRSLERIQKAIREIQVKHDIEEYIAIGIDTLDRVKNNDIKLLGEVELQELIKTMNFYGADMIKLIRNIARDETKPYFEEIGKLVKDALLFEEDLKAEVVRRAVEANGKEILQEQKEQGSWGRNFRTISQQTDPIIRSFWELVKGSKAKIESDTKNLATLIEEKMQDLRRALPNKSGVDIFDFMLKETKSGELQIVAKYSSEFYEKLNKARATLKDTTSSAETKLKALAWMKKNTEFDSENYKKRLEEYTKQMKYVYKSDRYGEQKIQQRIKEYREKNGDNQTGYSNEKNFNVKIKEERELYSEEYKQIIDSPAKKAFYDLWMKHSNEFQDFIGQDLGGRFVWNVPKDFVDSMVENGLGAFTNLSSITEHLKARAGENIGNIDSKTGKPLLKIPAYYTEKNMTQNEKGEWVIDSKNQSRDLAKVLGIVGGMAYNHKYMSEIEGNAKSLEMILMDRETIMTNSNGESVVNKLTNKVQKIIGSANTLEQFQDYMNYYIYGARTKQKDYLFGKDNKYSAMAVYNTVAKYFVGKALAGNPVSIVANAVGGDLSARIVGAKGIFFNNEQYANASMNLLPRALAGNKKVGAIIEFFDLVDRGNLRKVGDDLSVNFLTRNLTYDKLFFGQKAGDYLIRNSVLLSMMQSHTVKDGKIVKKAEGDVSLLDTLDVKNEKLDLAGITEQELEKFRSKTLAVTDNILGNNTRDDIRLAQMTIIGRVLLMFRSWMPRTVDERYGELRFNNELGEYELGRYRSFWNQVANKKFFPLITETILGYGVFGYGGKFGNTTIEHAKTLYAEHKVKYPDDLITEQEYVDLHLANLRANMLEIYMTLALMVMIWAVAPDEGETLEQGSLRKYAHMQGKRILSELMFFYDPEEFNKIIRSPLPITRLLTDVYSFGKSLIFETAEEITGDESYTDKNELRKYSFKLVPALSGFETMLSFIEEDYDTKESVGVSSRNK